MLYIPEFQLNLFSIHKLAQENQCEVIFIPYSCEIVDTKSKQVNPIGKLENGFYYLDSGTTNIKLGLSVTTSSKLQPYNL